MNKDDRITYLKKQLSDKTDRITYLEQQLLNTNAQIAQFDNLYQLLKNYYDNCNNTEYYLKKDLNKLSIFRTQAKDLERKIDWVVKPNVFADAIMKLCGNKVQHLNKIANFFGITVDDSIAENVIQMTKHFQS